MKKHLFLFLLFFAFAINAQTTANRFFYKLTFKPNKDSIKTEKEMMILDINKEKSLYQSYQTIAQDSIFKVTMEAMKKTGNFSDMKGLSNSKSNFFQERILKNYPIKEIKFKNNIGFDVYTYMETPNFNWKILTEKEKIGSYDTQKATTEYGGRKWTAWFTTDIPFPDGPYKFSGLPGLIVKIEDSDKNYSWVLNGNKTISEMPDKLFMNETMKQFGMSKELTVPKEKFVKAYEEYKKDPTATIMRNISSSFGDISSSVDKRKIDKMGKERLAKDNNSIEISEIKEE